jgi:hypothetical protein
MEVSAPRARRAVVLHKKGEFTSARSYFPFPASDGGATGPSYTLQDRST